MTKKGVLRFLVIMTLVYPALMLFRVDEVLGVASIEVTEEGILSYQISVWISWVVLTSVAVFYKWTESRNVFFYFTYAFLVIAFTVFGILYQSFITGYELPSQFNDSYTLGVLIALQNIVVSGILTGFLQIAVWWFTRRWHRR